MKCLFIFLLIFSNFCLADAVIVFNEIMYHPAENEDALEWLELHNQMSVNIDLSGWRLSSGIDYTFPNDTIISGGNYIVVAIDPDALKSATGLDDFKVVGPFLGRLSNSGEKINLRDNSGRLMDSLEYSDGGKWPIGADGSGVSLAKINKSTASAHSENWDCSVFVGGTPGEQNFSSSHSVSVVLNEISSVTNSTSFIELYNYGTSIAQLENCKIISSGTNLFYTFPATEIAAKGYLSLDNSALGFKPAKDDKIYLFAADGKELLDAFAAKKKLRGRSWINHFNHFNPDWLYPNSETPGASNSFSFNNDIVINEIMYHQRDTRGTPGVYNYITNIVIDNVWKYNDTGTNLGTAWREVDYDDTSWPSGKALLYHEPDPLPAVKNTEISNPPITHYFRTEFINDGTEMPHSLKLNLVVDDGSVVYLNGKEIYRYMLPPGELSYLTTGGHGLDATFDGPFIVSADALVSGTNIIAVETHQATKNSGDVVFGLELISRSEIFQEVSEGESPEEWIELYNRGSSQIDISGWKLANAVDFEFPQGTIINPGGYIVVASENTPPQLQYPYFDFIGFKGKLSNSGEPVELIDAHGNPADKVHYFDGNPWPKYADGGGSSLELTNPFADNSIAENWMASDESLKSSWSNYTYRGIADNSVRPDKYHEFVMGLLDEGEILIDDIEVIEDPDGAATSFLQNGAFASGTDKWRLLGTHEKSEAFDDSGNNVLKLVATGPTEHMHNHAETTFLSGKEVTTGNYYEISYRAKWLAGNNQLNTRLYFNRVPKTMYLNVPDKSGTPGAQNSRFVSNAPPVFSDFIHSPAVPEANQAVTVTANINAHRGIKTTRLFWSLNEGSWSSKIMISTNNIFSETIPGFSEGIVQFYIEAVDNLNSTSQYPVAGSDAPALYKIEDGHATTLPTHNIRIVMNTSVVERMYLKTEKVSNVLRPCTIIYDEKDVFYNAGVRLKGSGYGRGKSGYKLVFPKNKLFRGVHSSITIDVSGKHMDNIGTSGSQEEILWKHVANRAGNIPMPNDDLVCVIRNDTRDSGILTMARFGNDYFDGQYKNGSEGKLFKFELIYFSTYTTDGNPESLKEQPNHVLEQPITVGGYNTKIDVSNLGDDKEFHRWHYLIRNHRQNDDYSKIKEMCKTFDLTGTNLENSIGNIIDEDEFMRTYAFLSLIGAFDVYHGLAGGGFHNNMFYVRPEDNKVLAIPIDMDWACRNSYMDDPLWKSGKNNLCKIIDIPRNTRKIYGHAKNIIDTSFNSDYLNYWANHYYSLVENQPGEFSALLAYVNGRTYHVTNSFPEKVNFEITSNNGEDFYTSELSVDIHGTAWIDINKIYIEGNPVLLSPEWNTITNWNINVGLIPGTNFLNFIGYDFQGQAVVSDSITVVSSAIPEYPSLSINELMAINDSTITDSFGEFDDWVEIYNYGSKIESLKNCFLTDDFSEKDKWAFPDVFAATNSYSLVWADGETNQGPMHANFKLSGIGEELALYYKTNNTFYLLDSVTFGQQNNDISFGRLPDAHGDFIDMESTPLAPNIPEPGIIWIMIMSTCYFVIVKRQMPNL